MARAVFAFFLACAMSLPAAAQSTTSGASGSAGCVGVLSHIGDRFLVKKVGITVFQNEESEVPIDTWHVDDLVAGKVSAFFGKRLAVRRIKPSPEALAAFDAPKPSRDGDVDVNALIRTAARPATCNRYVAITKRGAAYGRTKQMIGGLGIVRGGSPLTTSVDLFAYMWLRVYDGRSFALLRRKAGTLGQPTFMAGMRGPHREVDESWWPTSLDIEQDTKLRDVTRALVSETLDATLPELLVQ
jgi:hypothetical protein